MERGVLQQLRRTPFDPRVRRLAEMSAKFLDEPRLADAGIANDENELPIPRKSPLPGASKGAEILLTADEWA